MAADGNTCGGVRHKFRPLQGLWSRLVGSARFLGSRRRRSSGSEMADAAAEKQRIGDGGEVLGEEEQGAHIYRMGAFCPFVPGGGFTRDKGGTE